MQQGLIGRGDACAGVCALRGSASGMAKVARLTLGYYTVCTAAAVVLGIILVTVIEPGQGSPLSGGSVTSCHTPDLKVGASLQNLEHLRLVLETRAWGGRRGARHPIKYTLKHSLSA